MALGTTTFNLFTDVGLTIPFSGLYQLTHFSDLSDNPQDFVLYLGSNAAGTQLEAQSAPGTDPIVLTPVDTLPLWQASTAYSVGDRIQPTTPNGRRYRCTTAGTSDVSEPTFPTVGIGSSVVDGTCVWEYESAKHEITELKLATTSGGLTSATAGDPLALPNTILSGVGNAQEVHLRIENIVTNIGTNAGEPAVSVSINAIQEGDV
jgi:hypothetical protein